MDHRVVWAAVALIGAAGFGFWAKHSFPPGAASAEADVVQTEAGGTNSDPSVSPSVSPVATDTSDEPTDDECQRLLAAPGSAEAVAWLTAGGAAHDVPKWENAEVLDVVRRFYQAGSLSVTAVDVADAPGGQSANQFIVTLPSDPSSRRRVFGCEAEFQKDYDEQPTADQGQEYLSLTFD